MSLFDIFTTAEPDDDGEVHQFWIGQKVVFGCTECNEAAHSRDDLDHWSYCSVGGSDA